VEPQISLGHSLGEVTALVYCGVVSFEDGLKIISKRGEVMEKGAQQGTMMAVINIDISLLDDLCKRVSDEIAEPVVVANINAPQQIVISGSKKGIKMVAKRVLQNRGRGIPLNVGGAWHSPFLTQAAEEFNKCIDALPFNAPKSGFYSVVEQKLLDDPALIKDTLKRQMLSRVNWVDAIRNLRRLSYHTFLEIGPSKILKDLVKKIDPEAHIESTALFSDLRTLVQKL
jgi:[acyl-carrier-protein] S-malonyltransferase